MIISMFNYTIKLISYFCKPLIYCVLSADGRRHRLFEVWERSLVGSGWRHLPPHEDVVSSSWVLPVITLECKLHKGAFVPQVKLDSYNLHNSHCITLSVSQPEVNYVENWKCKLPLIALITLCVLRSVNLFCRAGFQHIAEAFIYLIFLSFLISRLPFVLSVFSLFFAAWKTNSRLQPWPTYPGSCQR